MCTSELTIIVDQSLNSFLHSTAVIRRSRPVFKNTDSALRFGSFVPNNNMYQETNGIDTENFANFSFPQTNDDGDASIPIVDNLLQQQTPPSDLRAANDFINALASMTADLQKFQESLALVHYLLYFLIFSTNLIL